MVTSFYLIFPFHLETSISLPSGSFDTAIRHGKTLLLMTYLLQSCYAFELTSLLSSFHCQQHSNFFTLYRKKFYQWTYNYQIHGSSLGPHLFNFSFIFNVDYNLVLAIPSFTSVILYIFGSPLICIFSVSFFVSFTLLFIYV